MPKRKIRHVDADALPQAEVSFATAPASEEPDKKRVTKRRSLFVRSLSSTTTTESLIEHFSQSFPVKHATAVIDRDTKQCKGYGFVTLADAEDAQRAKEELEGSQLDGKKIKIEIAEPRSREVEDTIPGVEKAKSKPAPRVAEAKRQREEQQQKDQAFVPRLIIRNLPWSIKKPDQLAKLFLSYGKIKSVELPQKKPGLLSGFGFVLLRGKKNAEKAIEGVNGKEIDGRTVAVDWAVDKSTWSKQASETAPVDSADEESSVVSSDSEDDDDESETEEGEEVDDSELAQEPNGEVAEDGRAKERPPQDFSSTLFIRNLPWTATDEDLHEHFKQFGGVRYARVVMERETERSKGTGFVCFFSSDDAYACLRNAPKDTLASNEPPTGKKDANVAHTPRSVLQNVDADIAGQYTLDGRVLQLSRAVDRNEAARLSEAWFAQQEHQGGDKRRLYLLSEGTIRSGSALHQLLSPSELAMREASFKQRRSLVKSNPSLHLSLTRIAVRNIPRSVSSRDLKDLARKAVAGFAVDVKSEKRERLSKEELSRGGEEMVEAERQRKLKGKGVVKQAKIVFENADGSKISEQAGAGRSRGYGFIEYYTHRNALMGLRWLNGHAIDYQAHVQKKGKATTEEIEDRKKRLIAEFALENAQVVSRRKAREHGARDPKAKDEAGSAAARDDGDTRGRKKGGKSRERQHRDQDVSKKVVQAGPPSAKEDEKLAARQKIIARKRALRRDKRQPMRKSRKA